MNANSPIVFTDGGMDTDVSWMQPRNAKSLIVVTDEGINTEVSWLQPLKANRPIEVTELGIVIDESSVHLKNAKSPMDVNVEGIVTCPVESGVISHLANTRMGPVARRTATAEARYTLLRELGHTGRTAPGATHPRGSIRSG